MDLCDDSSHHELHLVPVFVCDVCLSDFVCASVYGSINYVFFIYYFVNIILERDVAPW